jgi:asparagine synthase (glutamine-hydrolysing)
VTTLEIGRARPTLEAAEDGAWVLSVASDAPSSVEPPSSPLLADDGTVRVLFDGILHEPSVDDGRTPGGAQRVLEAYRRWGEGALERLRGTYAVVIWDAERELLLCARDPLGIVPLFWAEGNGRLLVSWSLGALSGHPAVSDELDLEAIADHVCLRWRFPQETLFKAIRRVPPGHVLRVSGSRREAVRYWHPAPASPEDWVTRDELEGFPDLFATAIDRCLSRGPAGVFLSGGLDSVSVAAMARDRSRAVGAPVPWALSLAMPNEHVDETEIQRGVAAKLGLPQVMVELEEAAGPENVLMSALRMSRDWPAPLTNYWLPAYQGLGREGVNHGCKVILTGTGGDEWLGVTPYYAADLLRAGDMRGLIALWLNLNRSYPVHPLRLTRNLVWRFGVRDMLSARAAHGLQATAPAVLRRRRERAVERDTPRWAAPDLALRARLIERAIESRPAPVTRDLYRRELDEGLDHALVSLEVEETYENGRRVGAPILQPYWDPDLIRFLVRTPPELLNAGGRSKGIVRDMVAGRFPELGFDRQKKVIATSYAHQLLQRDLPAAWRASGGVPCLEKIGVVDHSGLEFEVTRDLAKGDWGAMNRLWFLLSLEAWLKGRSVV